MYQRILDAHETAMLFDMQDGTTEIRNSATLLSSNFKGDLDVDVFRQALNLLSSHHLFLRSRIIKEEGVYHLHVDRGSESNLRVLESTYPQEIQAKYKYDMYERTVDFFLILNESSDGYFVIRANHAVADAHTFFSLFSAVWKMYSRIVNGFKPAVASSPFLIKSMLEMLHERWGNLLDAPESRITEDLKNDRDKLPRGKLANSLNQYIYTEQVVLDNFRTNKLINTAKMHRVSVNSIISAGILTEIRNRDLREGALPMVYTAPVDLRSRVHPEVQPLEVTNFIFNQVITFHLKRNSNILRVARQIDDRLRQDLAKRRLFPNGWLLTSYLDYIRSRGISTLSVSNARTVASFQGVDLDLEISKPTIGFTLNGNRKQRFEHLAAATRAGCGVYTYNNELTTFGNYFGVDLTHGELIQRSIESVLSLPDC